MDELPPEPAHLTFLRRLVTVLTATMILGIVAIVVLLLIRFTGENTAQSVPLLPEEITLPEGVSAIAVTAGQGWYAVVTAEREILIFDQQTGALRQRVQIATE